MSETVITFTLPGHPQGKGRARAFRRGDFIGHYTPEKTRSYEGMLRDAAARAMGDLPPFAVPVEVEVSAIFDIPASWSRRRRNDALAGIERPGKKPDIDNIIKAVVDACNGVVFKDDALIVQGKYSKVYGPAPMVGITVRAA